MDYNASSKFQAYNTLFFFYRKIFYKKMSLKKLKALRKFIFLYSLLMVVPSFDTVKPIKINN